MQDMTPAELEYALLLAREQVSGIGHTYPMQALRADKFARGLIEQHAQAKRMRAVYEAACAWRDGVRENDDDEIPLLNNLCEAVDMARNAHRTPEES